MIAAETLTLSAPYLFENAIPSTKFMFGKAQILGKKYAKILWKASEMIKFICHNLVVYLFPLLLS